MLGILSFFLVLGLLVFVHELGHFIAAKKAGAKVEEFGLGFPPRMFSIKKGETEYSINWIPLGGFVKILGENGEEKNNPRSFESLSYFWKVVILLAGVTMNMLLAIVLLAVGFMIGIPQDVKSVAGDEKAIIRDEKIQLYNVQPDSPAENAGINEGDQLVSIDGSPVSTTDEVIDLIKQRAGQETNFQIARGSENIEIVATPRENPPEGQGALGISPIKIGIVSYPVLDSLWLGVRGSLFMALAMIVGIVGIFRDLFLGVNVGNQVGGPIAIAAMTNQATKLGIEYLIQLTIIISINLAIFNLLPISVLDGGRIVLVTIESIYKKFKKKDLPDKFKYWVNMSGIVLIGIMIVLVTFNDIIRNADIFAGVWNSITSFL